MITVHYFAGIRQMTGIKTEDIDYAGMTVRQLKEQLFHKYPEMQGSSLHVAVNEEYALPTDILSEGDAVALIPPVSGG